MIRMNVPFFQISLLCFGALRAQPNEADLFFWEAVDLRSNELKDCLLDRTPNLTKNFLLSRLNK
jgi:hypothetical protein